MSDRAVRTAELQCSLYAYVFDDDVSPRFRRYRERTRVERFRQHYLVQLGEHMYRDLPRFILEVGAPRIEDVIRLRVELPGTEDLRQRLARWQPLALVTAERHPRAAMARELFWLERARALALTQPPASVDELLAAIDGLAAESTMPDPAADRPPIFHTWAHSSLPELLPMPLGRTPGIEAAARMPWPRHCITYHGAVDGRLHRKCARELDELRALVSSCRGGVDL